MRELEMWGGHECTVNRVGDRFFDQTRLSGHEDRIGDLERFAALGIKTLRYPVLWERTAPERPDQLEWAWPDARLDRLGALGLRPIVGLAHHGSGPRYTNLLDESFAPGLAAFAGAVARRYPQVSDWTPVNEPLTTARFSALYGHWYPHAADERAFWTALLNQIDGVRLAMTEIRAVNPAARLIQTEDLGRTYATPRTSGQAEFDNQRRWMTWDLLCGRVTPGHPFWDRLAGFGVADRLRAIADAPCPPDVIGVNHYVTSDRFLDERLAAYPERTWGGNDALRFADVEAIRVLSPGPGGLEGALEEAAARYGLTLAVTESHLACTREEQVRWLLDAWRTALDLRTKGVAIEAVTAWALLGAFDWQCLLTRSNGCYESGAFDVGGRGPRPTAVAATVRALTALDTGFHPAADGPGWWRRDVRLEYPPALARDGAKASLPPRPTPPRRRRPLLITGATGTLARALSRACVRRGLDHVLTDRARLSLDSDESMARVMGEVSPWAVINAAGWVRVDDAETEPAACFAANAKGAARLARVCRDRGLPFVGFSSDLVFDGRSPTPYGEGDAPCPLNAYGRSKAWAEREVLALEGALMVRTSAFFSPHDPYNFASHVLRELGAGRTVPAAADLAISPTYVPDLADAVVDLLIDGESGLWHLANRGTVSWARFAEMIAGACGFDPARVLPAPWRSFGWPAERPAHVPLASTRGALLPTLEDAVDRFAAAVRQRAAGAPARP